jgi:hypothetical protein
VKIVTKVATPEPVHALVIPGAPAPTSTPASPPTRMPYPTYTPDPAYKYPAPELICPLDKNYFLPGENVKLMWRTPVPLAEDEWYEVRWSEQGKPPAIWWVKRGELEDGFRPQCSRGCRWGVRIVRGLEEGQAEEYLSPPSWTWSFHWVPMIAAEISEAQRNMQRPDPCLVPIPTPTPMPAPTPIPTPPLWP